MLHGVCSRCVWRAPSLAKGRSFTSSTTRRRAQHVRIVEVGPRDGLQNEKKSIPVATKIELVRRLARTGLATIEAGSFVSPKWVPQMANSSEILQDVLHNEPPSPRHVTYQWLLPNTKGLENYLSTLGENRARPQSTQSFDGGPALNTSSWDANAMPSAASAKEAMAKNRANDSSSQDSDSGPALGTSAQDTNATPSTTLGAEAMYAGQGGASAGSAHEISLFMAATESFSQKNTNCSVDESLRRFRELISRAQLENTTVRAYISVALGCPYEGPDVDPHRVAEICTALLEMGADEISVADTTGMGTPPRTRVLLKTLQAAGVKNEDLALHFHDTYGQALVNTLVGLEHGVGVFDGAVGGLGGCPFSPGATGNVATEDLVNFFEGLGVRTGVDLQEVSRIGAWISEEVGRVNESRAGRATLAKLESVK